MIASRRISLVVALVGFYIAFTRLPPIEDVSLWDLLAVYWILIAPLVTAFFANSLGVIRAGAGQLVNAEQRLVNEYKSRLDRKAEVVRGKLEKFPK